jgi:hypothetical protein
MVFRFELNLRASPVSGIFGAGGRSDAVDAPTTGILFTMTFLLEPNLEGTKQTTKINMQAIDEATGSLQVCAIAPDGAVLHNRARLQTRFAVLPWERSRNRSARFRPRTLRGRG